MTTQNPPPERKDVAPPNATEDDMRLERGRPLTTGKGGKLALGESGNKSFFTYIVLVAVSLGLSFFLFGQGNVKQQDFSNNIAPIAKDITTLKDSDKVIASDITGLKTAVSTQGNQVANTDAKIAPLSNQIAALQSSVNGIPSTVNSQVASQIASQLAGVAKQTDVSAVQSQMASAQSSLGTVKDSVAGLKTTIDEQAKTIKDLQAKVTALQSQPSTSGGIFGGTTTTAGTVTDGQVTAVVLGNSFTGSQTLSFPSISANTSASQSFVVQVANGLGRTSNNIQLAVGLELFDTNNNMLNPTPTPFANANNFSLSGMNLIWTQQSTGYTYFIGFTNSSSTSIFGNLGVLSQGTGITNYTLTVSIRNDSGAPSQAINIIPIVKVTYAG